MAIVALLYVAFVVLMVASLWKTFDKAGQPGWAALVPIYNAYVLTQIAGKPQWWIALYFIPLVNIYAAATTIGGIATRFGKGTGFAVGLFFLGFIFWPMLAFGDAQYSDPRAA